MRNAQRFSFTEGFDAFGVPGALPQLPLSLTYRGSSLEISALLDTGASVNVLPHSSGVQQLEEVIKSCFFVNTSQQDQLVPSINRVDG